MNMFDQWNLCSDVFIQFMQQRTEKDEKGTSCLCLHHLIRHFNMQERNLWRKGTDSFQGQNNKYSTKFYKLKIEIKLIIH